MERALDACIKVLASGITVFTFIGLCEFVLFPIGNRIRKLVEK